MKRSLFIVALGLAGCNSEPTFAERVQACLDNTIQQNLTAYWVQGTWRLHGSGKRSGCSDPALNTEDVELGSIPFRVHQAGYALTVEPASVTTPFDFDGTVGARCVRFHTVEPSGTSEIHYDFPGEFVGTRSIEGEYSGDGPGSCRSEGSFTLSVELDPIPRPIKRDAGTSDARPLDAVAADAIVEASAIDGADDGEAGDAADDGERGDAADAGMDEAIVQTDAMPDVPDVPLDDAAVPAAEEYTYVSWDFAASAAGSATAAAKSSCSFGAPRQLSSWAAPGLLLGLIALRRRRL
jgi:hypothetical protein